MDATLLRSLLFLTIAIAVVLGARRLLRQAFGAGPAFTLWMLPLLAVGLPWIPAMPAHWLVLPAIQVLPGNTPEAGAQGHAALVPWLWSAWLAGTSAGLLRLVVRYAGIRRRSRKLPTAMLDTLVREWNALDPRRLRMHPAGPALLWGPRTLLLLPPDFMQRFSTGERQLILRHELAHLHRGDVLWNLLAELTGALLWFHPLIWLALPRFRLDQELACDERVLRHSPQDEAGYAHILMHSVGTSNVPTLIPWLAEPQLKERLIMIQRHRPGALRRRMGYLGLAALMAGSTLVAQAASKPDQPAEADLSFNLGRQAGYPATAIRNHEEGTVVLTVQVLADGTVGSIRYDPQDSSTTSADLIAAASNAARQWRFNPQTKGGKPVAGYARVPIKFSLTPLPEGRNREEAEKSSSKH